MSRRKWLGSVLMASVVVMATFGAASAQESVKVGRWTVYGGVDDKNPAACAAVLSEGGKEGLRLLNTGRGWTVGMPYYGPKKKVEVYYGFENAAEVANLTWDGSVWAMMPINGDQLAAFRDVPVFAITLGTKELRWKLAGAGPAIDRAAACSRDRGLTVKPAPQAVPPMPPQAGPPMPAPAANGCPAPGSVRSQNSSRPVEVMFVNLGKAPLDIYWIDYKGEWKKYQRVAPNSNVKQKTFATHPWIAVDPRGRCHGGVMMGDPNDRTEGANMFQIWD